MCNDTEGHNGEVTEFFEGHISLNLLKVNWYSKGVRNVESSKFCKNICHCRLRKIIYQRCHTDVGYSIAFAWDKTRYVISLKHKYAKVNFLQLYLIVWSSKIWHLNARVGMSTKWLYYGIWTKHLKDLQRLRLDSHLSLRCMHAFLNIFEYHLIAMHLRYRLALNTAKWTFAERTLLLFDGGLGRRNTCGNWGLCRLFRFCRCYETYCERL